MRYTIVSIVLLLLSTSCKKVSVGSFDFDVTTNAKSYKVGDTIRFQFAGNPDNIAFYSGEAGNNYVNKDRTSVAGTPTLDFTSLIKNGVQNNSLQLLVSKDFKGIYDSTNAVNATWTDITNRAVLSTGLDNTPSGTINLSDFASATEPVFFAFKFNGAAGTTQRTWVIRSFNLKNNIPNEPTATLATIADAGWLQVSILGPTVKWSFATDLIRFDGPSGVTVANEDYAITKAFYLNRVNPDRSIPVKNMSTYTSSYSYRFSTPGTYNATFVASIDNVGGQSSIVKTVTLTIVP